MRLLSESFTPGKIKRLMIGTTPAQFQQTESRKIGSQRTVFILLAVYFVLCALGLYRHELFLDEAHHFLIGRDSATLSEVYYNARYDGHPRLWHAILFLITHYITPNPIGMQVFQLLVATGAAWVFLRYAPFSLPVKAAILFGYYFIFEYSLLSRNYVLGILFLFVCCHLLDDARRNLLWIGLLLLLMCNTHVFYTFASACIFLILFVDYARKRQLLTRPFIFFTGLFLLGCACALVQARVPTVDNVNLTPVHPDEWLSPKNFSFAGFGLIRGWLPVPQVSGGRFWNSYWLNEDHIGRWVRNFLFCFFLAFPSLLLRKSWRGLLFYYSGVFLLLVFFVVTQMSASRYFGMVFIFFIVAAWLSAEGSADVFSFASIPGSWETKIFFRLCLFGILGVQAAIGAFAWEQDFTRPFSQSRNAARYVEGFHQKIVVDGYNAGPMLCAYLGGKVLYLATGKEGSFCVWKKSYFPVPRPDIGKEIAGCDSLQSADRFILVSNRMLDVDSASSGHTAFRLTALRFFDHSITGENYYIYQASPL